MRDLAGTQQLRVQHWRGGGLTQARAWRAARSQARAAAAPAPGQNVLHMMSRAQPRAAWGFSSSKRNKKGRTADSFFASLHDRRADTARTSPLDQRRPDSYSCSGMAFEGGELDESELFGERERSDAEGSDADALEEDDDFEVAAGPGASMDIGV